MDLKSIIGAEGMNTLDTTIRENDCFWDGSTPESMQDRLNITICAPEGYENNIKLKREEAREFLINEQTGSRMKPKDLNDKPVRAFYFGTHLIGIQHRDTKY